MYKLILYKDFQEHKVLKYDDHHSRLITDIGEGWVEGNPEKNSYAVEHQKGPANT